MIGYIIIRLVDLYSIIIFIYVIMSWLPRNGFVGQLYDLFGRICDPYLDLFRKFIPPIGGMVDISPIFAIIALELIARVIAFIL